MWCRSKPEEVSEPAAKVQAEAYARAVGMNQANTKMAVVMATQGPQAAANAMLKEHNGDYCSMRMMYG